LFREAHSQRQNRRVDKKMIYVNSAT
jgi:hypothetical protein